MRRLSELVVFVSLALGLHLFLAMRGPEAGGSAGGSGGEAAVTLAGASAQIETVLDDWTRPPQAQMDIAIEQPNIAIADAPPAPALEVGNAPRAEIKIAALAPSETPKAPDVSAIQTPIAPPPEVAVPELSLQTVQQRQPPKTSKSIDRQPPSQQLAQPAAPTVEATLAAPESPSPPPAPKPEPKPQPKQKPKPKKNVQKADRVQKASAGAAAQEAAGNGGSAEAGASGTVQAVGKGKAAKLRAIWGAKITARIERNKRTPRGVKGEALVHIRMKVAPNGRLLSVNVAKSSGIAAFDQAAIQAVKRAKRFAKAPKQLTASSYGFSFPMRFSIK